MGILGQWGDMLRVIGRYLDSEGAENVEIDNKDQIAVRFKKGAAANSTSYSEFDIAKLREQAPMMRRPVSGPPKGDREELLRTLGQEMDDQGITVTSVVEVAGQYRVQGTDARGPIYRFYSRAELQQLSLKRREMRQPQTDNPESASS